MSIKWETSSDWDNATSKQRIVNSSGTLKLLKTTDDFNDNSFDTSKWRDASASAASVSESNQRIDLNYGGGQDDRPYLGAAQRHSSDTGSSMVVEGNIWADNTEGQARIIVWWDDSYSGTYSQRTNGIEVDGKGMGIVENDSYTEIGSSGFGYGQTNTNSGDLLRVEIYGDKDNFDIYVYKNGTQTDSATGQSFSPSQTPISYIGYYGRETDTTSHVDNATVWALEGSLTTSTKSFSDPAKPNLKNLTYSVNGGSITVDVIGSPGTSDEETVNQTLDGSSSYDLSWSNSHTDFRLKISLDGTSDYKSRPTVSSLSLEKSAEKLGTIRLQAPSGPVSVPVFNPSKVEYPVFRVHTPDGTGSLNLVEPSKAELDQLRIHTESYGTLAVSTTLDTTGGTGFTGLKASVTLNGDSVSVKVYEDLDGDGEAENTEIVTLEDGEKTYSLDSIQITQGASYWVDVYTSGSVDTSPEIDYIKITQNTNTVSTALNTDVLLNGGEIELIVFEDVDGDGEAENTEQVTVPNGSNKIDLDSIDINEGNEYWIEAELVGSDITSSPELNSTEISNVGKWNSSSDWDTEQSNSGVNHAYTANTDYQSAGKLQKGYAYEQFPMSQGLVGWWTLHDDSAQDYSGNGNHGTVNGATFGVSAPGGIRGASFDGDNIELVQDSVLNPGTESRSVSAWVKSSDLSASQTIYSRSYGDKSAAETLGSENSSATIRYYLHDGSNSNIVTVDAPAFSNDEWVHLVGVRDVESSEMLFYINGKLKSTSSFSTVADMENAGGMGGPYYISETQSGYNNNWFGEISDVRSYSRALSPQEIQHLYEQGAQAAAPKDGVARYEFEGDVTDSWNSNDGTNNGASFVDGKYGQAAEFNSSNPDYIDLPSLGLGGDARHTVVGWVKLNSVSSSDRDVIYYHGDASSSSQLFFGVYEGEWNISYYSDDVFYGAPQEDTWYHVAAIYDGNKRYGYVNGKLVSVDTPSTPSFANNDYAIGYRRDTNEYYFDGLIDDLRIYPYALSARQVSALYHGWSDLARPTTDGLVAHYKLNGDVNDSVGSNDGTNNGVTFERGVRGQAGSFDFGDQIQINTPVTSDPFSISLWIKPESLGDGDNFINNRNDSDWSLQFRWGPSSTVEAFIKDGGGSNVSLSGGNFTTNQWYFLTLVYDGNISKLYSNGSAIASDSSSTEGYTDAGYDWSIGRHVDSGGESNGTIDDVRIYNRALEPWEIHEIYRWGTRGRDLREKLVRKKG